MKPPVANRSLVLTIATVLLIVGAFGLAKRHIISYAAQGVLTALAVGIQLALYRQKSK